jgi:hypothetical protein
VSALVDLLFRMAEWEPTVLLVEDVRDSVWS